MVLVPVPELGSHPLLSEQTIDQHFQSHVHTFESQLVRTQSVEEEAEAVAAEQELESHPLLSKPPAIAVVAPLLPARVFLPTRVNLSPLSRSLPPLPNQNVRNRAVISCIVAPLLPAGVLLATQVASDTLHGLTLRPLLDQNIVLNPSTSPLECRQNHPVSYWVATLRRAYFHVHRTRGKSR